MLRGMPRGLATIAERAVARAEAVIAATPEVHHDMPWICAQRWEEVLFLSWEVPVDEVRALVPDGLELDLLDGRAYASLLPLKMAHVHLRGLPGIPDLSDFPELNLRTYVRRDDEPGVFFLSLDAPSEVAVLIGRHVFHVRYEHARMAMDVGDDGRVTFDSARTDVDATFAATYRGTGPAGAASPGSLEAFLTERYAMYGVHPDGALVRGDIRHPAWQLRSVELDLQPGTVLAAGGLAITRPPDHVAFSDATDNVVWPMVRA
jgi:uncharacterized protein YqjF (DUF2071 family)